MGAAGAVAGASAAATLGSAYMQNKHARAISTDQANAKTHLYDPTNPVLRGLAGQNVQLFQNVLRGHNPFEGMGAPLQHQATNQLGGMLNQPAPEQQAFSQMFGDGRALNNLFGAPRPGAADHGGFATNTLQVERPQVGNFTRYQDPIQTPQFQVGSPGFSTMQLSRAGVVGQPFAGRSSWDEAGYLAANPDVAQAVREGRFQSGQQHYQTNGIHEGRQNFGPTAPGMPQFDRVGMGTGNAPGSFQELQTQGFNVGTPGFSALQLGRANIAGQPLGGPNASEVQAPGNAFSELQPQLMNVGASPFAQQMQLPQIQAAANPFTQQMAFSNGFSEMQNPFAQMGHENPGQRVVDASQNIFDRNLRQANAALSSNAPNRFGSAFQEQGIGLNQRAIDDFNVFSAQQLMAGEQLRAQQQQQALQFMLGSRGLQQDATQQTNANNLQARGLAQGAFNDQQGAQLQASALNQQGALTSRGLAQEAHGQNVTQQLAAAQQNNSAQQGARALQQQAQQAADSNTMQAEIANQNAALQSFGLTSDAISKHNQASLQAHQLFQSGQIDARGLEQQLFTSLQQLGLDANTAAQQARLQARELQQSATATSGAQQLQAQMANQAAQLQAAGISVEAISRHNQATLQAHQLFQQGQLDARGLEQQLFQSLQQIGLDANTAAQQARLQAQQIALQGATVGSQLNIEAARNQNQAALQARGLSQDAFFQGQQQQIDRTGQWQQGIAQGSQLAMQGAQAVGQAPFQRALEAAALGMGMTQQQIAPLMQILQSGFQYGLPSDLNAVVGGAGFAGGINPVTGKDDGIPRITAPGWYGEPFQSGNPYDVAASDPGRFFGPGGPGPTFNQQQGQQQQQPGNPMGSPPPAPAPAAGPPPPPAPKGANESDAQYRARTDEYARQFEAWQRNANGGGGGGAPPPLQPPGGVLPPPTPPPPTQLPPQPQQPQQQFDEAAYLAANPDVAAAVAAGQTTALQHWQTNGIHEGRQMFNPNAYLAANPDVAAAIRAGQFGGNPLLHFQLHGRAEGRRWR